MLLGKRKLTRKTFGVGDYVDGLWVDAVDTTTTIKASAQPITGRERELLEEGVRMRARFVIYTRTRLNLPDIAAQKRGDVVVIEGRDYEIIAELDYDYHKRGVRHHQYAAAEVGVDAP